MTTLPKSAPVRRPQAERTADTRAKLIQAAITCLHRTGYASTTVSTVAHEAGVSRGAMTHQFPAKTDLMLAVVSAVFRSDSDYYNMSLTRLSPIEWMHALPSMMWEVLSRPGAIAVMEIMLAARSDLDLAEKLRDIQSAIDASAHAWMIDRHVAAGIDERPDGPAIHRLFVAAVRGLALEAIFMRNRAEVEKSITVLRDLLFHLYPALVIKEKIVARS